MLKKTAAALLLTSGTAMAADGVIGFNHIGARYLYSDIENSDGDGYGLDLNVALTNYLFVDVDFNTREFEDGGDKADFEFFSGGLGLNFPLNEDKTLQVFGGVTWEQLDVSANVSDSAGAGGEEEEEAGGLGGLLGGLFGLFGTADTTAKNHVAGHVDDRVDGYGVNVGIRATVWNNLEANASVKYRDYSDFEETLYGVGAAYTFGDWAAVLRYERFDDFEIDEYSLGVRYTFGNDDGTGSIW